MTHMKRRAHRVLLLALAGLGLMACRPKETMAPVSIDALDPGEREVLDGTLEPPWGTPTFERARNRLEVLSLDEPGAPSMQLRLAIGIPASTDAAVLAVITQALRSDLARRLQLIRADVVVNSSRPDRIEVIVRGHGLEAPELFEGLGLALSEPPSRAALSRARGQLVGSTRPPDTRGLATASVVAALLDRPRSTQLVTVDSLRALSLEELGDAWPDLLNPAHAILMIHGDLQRVSAGDLVSALAAQWIVRRPLERLFRAGDDPLARLRQGSRDDPAPREGENAASPLPLERATPLERGAVKGRPTVAVARQLRLDTPKRRALARLTQRYLQTRVDVRLTIEGDRGVLTYLLPVRVSTPRQSLDDELSRVLKVIELEPRVWEISQALSLWLGARTVAASLDGEDWTALASEAISLSATSGEVAAALTRDAIEMVKITPEELSSFAREEFSPTRSDNRWRWVLAGGDEALAAALGVPSTSPPPADPGE